MSQMVQITERINQVDGTMKPQRVLTPTLDLLGEKIRQVPAGAVRDLDDIRAELAREHGADITCAVSTSRVLKVIAVIAHSAVTLGDPAAVPFWRVVDTSQPGGERLAGGRSFITAQQARERRAEL